MRADATGHKGPLASPNTLEKAVELFALPDSEMIIERRLSQKDKESDRH